MVNVRDNRDVTELSSQRRGLKCERAESKRRAVYSRLNWQATNVDAKRIITIIANAERQKRTIIAHKRTIIAHPFGAKSNFRDQTDKNSREMPKICAESRWHVNCFCTGSDFEPCHTNQVAKGSHNRN